MANEIGYWNGGAGAAGAYAIFSGDKSGNIAAAIYTAVGSQQITQVRVFVTTNAGAANLIIALFATSAGAITGSPLQSVTIPISGNNQQYQSGALTWSLSNGVAYALAITSVDAGVVSFRNDVRVNGIDVDSSAGAAGAAWSHSSNASFAMELAGDVTAAAAPQPYPWQSQGAMGVIVAS